MGKVKKKWLFWENSEDIELVASLLCQDKIGICSTDTLYGFLGNLTQASFERINQLKGGRSGKPYIVLTSCRALSGHGSTGSPRAAGGENSARLEACWPGPLTIIFKASEGTPNFIAPDGTVAMRCPDHAGLQKLLEKFDGLFSTSANRSGKEAPATKEAIDEELLDEVDFLITDKVVDKGEPSTIIDCSTGVVKLVRAGAYPIEEIERYYGKKIER